MKKERKDERIYFFCFILPSALPKALNFELKETKEYSKIYIGFTFSIIQNKTHLKVCYNGPYFCDDHHEIGRAHV